MLVEKTDTHTLITLNVSRDFPIPAFLQEDIPILESLLKQTQELWELQQSMKLKGDNDSLKLMYDKKLMEASIQAQKDLAKETDRWIKEKAGLQREITEALLEKNQLASQLDLKNQALAGKLQAALGEIQQLQESRSQHVALLRSELSQRYESELDTLKGFVTSYKSERDYALKKVDDLMSSKNKNSSILGQQGETDFADICAGAGISVEHTGKDAHKGDYIGTIFEQKVLMEVKNYSYVVPTKEVTKFKRDMDENKDCIAGIFCSLKTGITHIRDSFHIEWLHDGRMLIFLSDMEKYDCSYLLEIVKRLIGIVTRYTSDDEECVDMYKERIEKACKHIEACIKKTTDVIKNIRLYRKQSGEMFDSLEKTVKLLKDDIADVLTGLNGSKVDEEVEEAAVAAASPSPQKAGGRKKKVSHA